MCLETNQVNMDKQKLEGLKRWQQGTCHGAFAMCPMEETTVFQAKAPLWGKGDIKKYKGTDFLSGEGKLFFKQVSGFI